MADRISNLSDSLLCHILSFLPTKEAVATSILSKRLRPLWLYTPSFDFEDGLYASNKIQYLHFVQFVYAFLVSRDVQPIKRFHLNCVSSYTSNQNIKVWTKAAIHRQVEHLEFKSLPNYILLPSSTIFTCKTIVVMKLNSVKLDAVSSVCLPSLKIVHLRSVHFSKISCVPKLLSGCSTLLENLVIRYIHLSHKAIDYPHVFTKDFPKLISANVHIYNWDLLRAFSKAKFIHYEFPEKESNYEAYTNDHFVGAEIPLPPLLRKCYVGGFDGKGSEMQFARFIMKNATLLNTITISSSSLSSLDEKHGMLKKLSSIPRLSSACQLYFE